MKKILKILSNKIFLTMLSFLIQIALTVYLAYALSYFSVIIYAFLSVISIIICIFILGRDDNPSFKIAWIFLILALPLFGWFLFLFLGRKKLPKKKLAKMQKVDKMVEEEFLDAQAEMESSFVLNPTALKIAQFVSRSASYPVYTNTQSTYLKIGEEYYAALIRELEKAEKFIFMEYFIIEEGKFWNDVLTVLKKKAAVGVDVRVIYDDFGCLFKIPDNYYKQLIKFGIKCSVFNKLSVSFDLRMNNRSHRKIAVIDGVTAFTGGINIGDEYINETVKLGHWKDTGMMFKGSACWSFTLMFLSVWSIDNTIDDLSLYRPPEDVMLAPEVKGFIQPLSGGPGKNLQLLENSIIQIINNAARYVYINTPYLILDNETVTALCLAAKSGVDVRITMPHIPDKKLVFIVSRSFYPVLLKAGVRIYEYVPGFIHAKSVVSDDNTAYIGTCNMDYRSFYLHYECGAMLYDTDSILDIRNDFTETLKSCREISYEQANDVTAFTRVARSVLRVFAPLM